MLKRWTISRMKPTGSLFEHERDDTLQVIFARQANQSMDQASGKQILVFTDGYLYEFSRTGKEGRVIQFEQSAMPLEPKKNLS